LDVSIAVPGRQGATVRLLLRIDRREDGAAVTETVKLAAALRPHGWMACH